MFAKASAILVFATAVLAASVPRADDRLEVTVRHVQLNNEDNKYAKYAHRSLRERL